MATKSKSSKSSSSGKKAQVKVADLKPRKDAKGGGRNAEGVTFRPKNQN